MKTSFMVGFISKSLVKYLFPPVVHDFYNYCRQILAILKFRESLKANAKWQNTFSGEQVFIIGNGPSLSKVNLDLIVGKKIIVMNSFEKAEWKEQVEIVAHCIGEPDDSKSWSEVSFIESITGTNSLTYWMHYTSKNKLHLLEKIDLIHYVFPILEPGLWRNRCFTLHRPTLGYQTTAQLAIQVALYMGFKQIFLLGFDHDWLANPDYSRHFYSDCKDDTDGLENFSYLDIINFMKRMWNIYYAIKESAISHKAVIYNLNPISFLDIFERMDIANLDQQRNVIKIK